MNQRQRELVEILLSNHQRALLIKDLANQVHCSEKTVRNDLQTIDKLLKDYPSAYIIRKPGTGVFIEINEKDRARLFHALFRKDEAKDKRVMNIAYRLLTKEEPITIQNLSETYFMPNAIIKDDLNCIQQWLESFGLSVECRQGLGHYIKGDEINRRIALAHIEELTGDSANFLLDLFMPFEVATVKQTLDSMCKHWDLPITSESLNNLLVHVLIIVKRTKCNAPISILQQNESIFQSIEYQAAKWGLQQLAEKFCLTFSESELIYFTWHIRGSKKYEETIYQQKDEPMKQILSTLIKTMQQLTRVPFSFDDQLVNGLTIHLDAVVNRLMYGFPISNPLLFEIKKMYPYMFSMVTLASERINDNFNLDIPEEEVAYIVLHFQASIERLDAEKHAIPKVLIVCDMGIGMSRLLQAKVEKQYQELKIVGAIGKGEVQAFLKENDVNLVISTTPLENVKVPSIIISPLLEATDKEKLQKYLKRRAVESSVLAASDHVLCEFIDEESIFTGIRPQHRFQIVEMLGNMLYKQGKVDKSYIHQALLRERKSATSIGGGVAIPHGDPILVRESTIAVALLDKPIDWGTEKVSIVFMLALENDKANPIKAIIHKISALSKDPEMVGTLLNARNKQNLLRILNERNL
ncbi:BglG family transcription antiterminator [Virgibacillus proomii]|uniref:BglG family transcription antiterminator n=1 Tax=Virgibacillus proomii TaxID=84407 RepID=UPI001C0F9580|nr:BglG family transcription antiterminator [Virgibacillus proomii]MBU5266995.1 BglG family transcription antiterminator [Virgibacillus proomii]